MAVDYGPVPISRLKDESSRIFEALSARRRVLVSRHGRVVAAIEPASPQTHRTLLAAYAVGAAQSFTEFTATDFGQRSPSEFIRQAEAGQASLVTRDGKVFGILMQPDTSPLSHDPADQEKELAAFEREHPDASPEEFAEAVAAVSAAPSQVSAFAGDLGWASAASMLSVEETRFDTRLLSNALLVRGMALERTHDLTGAKNVFARVIEDFGEEDDGWTRRQVAQSMVLLARIYVSEGRSSDALTLTAQAVEALSADEEDARSPTNAEIA
jgi:antitoxin (DNA-binding transcriptional repressor) of toxin-antitoxin stability system